MMEFLPIETPVVSHVTMVISYTLVIIFGTVIVMGAGVIVMLQVCVEEVMYDLYTLVFPHKLMFYSSYFSSMFITE